MFYGFSNSAQRVFVVATVNELRELKDNYYYDLVRVNALAGKRIMIQQLAVWEGENLVQPAPLAELEALDAKSLAERYECNVLFDLAHVHCRVHAYEEDIIDCL